MGFWVYILRCADNSYYTGHTDNLEKRIVEHNTGQIEGYTCGRLPVALVFADEFPSREEALARERQIKGWNRKKKEAMMRGDWAEVSRLAHANRPRPSTDSGRTECVTFARLKESFSDTTQQPSIEVILFDLGNVILPFNHFQIAEKLSRFSRAKQFQDPDRIFSYLFDFEKGAINPFDLGKVSPREFFQTVKENLDLSVSFDEFVSIWCDIFVEDQEVSRLIRSLKNKWKLGLLSNTDPLHFGYILSKFSIMAAFDKWILSYEVGFKKPAIQIFQKAIEWASVRSEKILYFDDTKEYVEAAAALGIQSVHFISEAHLKQELQTRLQVDDESPKAR